MLPMCRYNVDHKRIASMRLEMKKLLYLHFAYVDTMLSLFLEVVQVTCHWKVHQVRMPMHQANHKSGLK